tara:strand:- start:347 stop:661 length:315 start_codon:yes stop_codon:yes gene_type:complete
MKITKSKLKQLIIEELQDLQEAPGDSAMNQASWKLGMGDPQLGGDQPPEREDIFAALGLDEQTLIDWANTHADEESGPWSRVQVIDPPDKRLDGALELKFQFLP